MYTPYSTSTTFPDYPMYLGHTGITIAPAIPAPTPFATNTLLPNVFPLPESLSMTKYIIDPSTNMPIYLPPLFVDNYMGMNERAFKYPTMAVYPDLNLDSSLRKQITNKFYDKVINNWLKYQYMDLYRYVTASGNKASLIKNIDQLEKVDDVVSDIKHNFLIDNFLSKNDLYVLLEKFVNKYRINWWDVKNYSLELKEFIHDKMLKHIKKEIFEHH